MRHSAIAAFSCLCLSVAAPALADPPPWSHAGGRHDDGRDDKHGNKHWDGGDGDGREDYRRYDYDRPDPRYGYYQPDRYYVDSNRYAPRRLGYNDRVYRGRDNRYYCRRSDGTTGLIIGGIAGGVIGDAIAPGGSKTIGAILGGGTGALIGRSIDRSRGVTCR